jgi:8-hydroxy-5-deazaflavin:NADPH oxidoreductase
MTSANTLPTLAILGGTGKEGPGLALRWAKAGYPVIIGSRQAEKALTTAQELNARLGLASIRGMENVAAARLAEISVLTVVQAAHQEALLSVKEALQGKILVDATARVDFRNPKPPEPPSAARQAQELLGASVRVVAAFQNVPAHALKRDLDQPLNADVLVCADDLAAAQAVMALAQGGGMRAYFAGGLDNALTVEGLTALLIAINGYYKINTASIRIAGFGE